jgi:hypothetical protein
MAGEIVIDGVARTLKYNTRAIAELELQSEKHVGWFLRELAEGRCGFAVASWLVWAGLQHEATPPSRAAIEAWLDAEIAEGRGPRDCHAPIVRALAPFLGVQKKSEPATESA